MVFKGSTEGPRLGDSHPQRSRVLRLIAYLAARSAQIRRKWDEEKRRGGESTKASSLAILKIELPSCIPTIQRHWIRSSGSKTMEGTPKKEKERERVTVNWTDDTGKSWEAGMRGRGRRRRESSVALSEIRGKMDARCHAFKARKSPANPLGPDEDGQLEGWKSINSLWRVLEEEGIVDAR